MRGHTHAEMLIRSSNGRIRQHHHVCMYVCMYMCVCMYVSTYVYVYVYRHAHARTHARTHTQNPMRMTEMFSLFVQISVITKREGQ